MTPIELILISLLSSATLSLVLYYLLIFSKFKTEKNQAVIDHVPVSVVISSRNERKKLAANLPSILSQDYPNFEVVVVNDGSYDGTKELLEELSQSHSNLKPVELNIDERYHRGKKFALTMGIKAAKNEQLLFTDADCVPSSDQWIKQMMASKTDKAIILGYAPLKQKFGMVAAFSYYETFHTALQYFSYALSGKTYMGVGRNLSYTKELFFKNKGFATHQHILSGDDDLFIQEVANKNNVSVCVDQDAFMYSEAPSGLGAFIKQKMRHISTSSLYQAKFKRLLGYYAFSQLFFVLAAVAAIIYPPTWIIGVCIVGFKYLVQWIVFFRPAMQLKAPYVAYFLPLFDLLNAIYLLLLFILRPFYSNKQWK